LYITENIINNLLILNFIATLGFVVTLGYINDPDKWAHIPIVAGFFSFFTSLLVATPFVFQFLFDVNGNQIIYVEIGFMYYAFFLLELLAWAAVFAYYLYLKLGWFEGIFATHKGGAV
jgi:hypothetical protein